MSIRISEKIRHNFSVSSISSHKLKMAPTRYVLNIAIIGFFCCHILGYWNQAGPRKVHLMLREHLPYIWTKYFLHQSMLCGRWTHAHAQQVCTHWMWMESLVLAVEEILWMPNFSKRYESILTDLVLLRPILKLKCFLNCIMYRYENCNCSILKFVGYIMMASFYRLKDWYQVPLYYN